MAKNIRYLQQEQILQTEGISLNSGRLNHKVVIKNESRNQENRFPGAGCITHLMEKADERG